jgi:hypothetical protein
LAADTYYEKKVLKNIKDKSINEIELVKKLIMMKPYDYSLKDVVNLLSNSQEQIRRLKSGI